MLNADQSYVCIILAAGEARRFKSNKLSHKINGKPLIIRTLQPFLELNNKITSVNVISGAYTKKLTVLLEDLNVKLLHNENYKEGGMISSIAKGIIQIKENGLPYSGIFIHLGDIPFIEVGDLQQMMKAFEQGDSQIIIPKNKQRRGHPVLIDINYIDELSNLKEEDMGLKGFINSHEHQIRYIDTDNDGILHDIDFKEDLNKIIHRNN